MSLSMRIGQAGNAWYLTVRYEKDGIGHQYHLPSAPAISTAIETKIRAEVETKMAISSQPPKDAETERPGRRLLARRALIVEDVLCGVAPGISAARSGLRTLRDCHKRWRGHRKSGHDRAGYCFYGRQSGGRDRWRRSRENNLRESDVAIIFVTAYADDQPTTTVKIRSTFGSSAIVGKPATQQRYRRRCANLKAGRAKGASGTA